MNLSRSVENNIPNEDFSVEDICREIGISRGAAHRKVKALIGYNVNDYISTVRLQKQIPVSGYAVYDLRCSI